MKKENDSAEFHEIRCPRCGRPQSRVKKKKKTEHVKFECECSQKFSLTFPGSDFPNVL